MQAADDYQTGGIMTFKELAEKQLQYEMASCNSFSDAFSKDPAQALDNCDSTYEHANRVLIIRRVLSSLANAETKGETEQSRVSFLRDFFNKQIHTFARWPRKSTSVTSNLSHQAELSAMVEMVELIDGWMNSASC